MVNTKPKLIKRYSNRKLYDTERSSYVVLEDIADMIRNQEEVRIIDNETKEDITCYTLTQIIFGAEKSSSHSTPIDVLKSIIRNGDSSFSNYLLDYLSMSGLNAMNNKNLIIEEQKKQKKPLIPGELPEHSFKPEPQAEKMEELASKKTLQARVASAALTPDSTPEGTTILPNSNRDLME